MQSSNTLLEKIKESSPLRDFIFCRAAQDIEGGARRFLILRERGQVYIRNWLTNCWDEIKDDAQMKRFDKIFSEATVDKQLDCLSI